METVCSYETSVNLLVYQTTQCYVPEESTFQQNWCNITVHGTTVVWYVHSNVSLSFSVCIVSHTGLAMPNLRQLVAGFPPQRPAFEPRSGHMGFVVDRVALAQAISKCFGFLCESFHRLLHAHNHPSSGAGTVDQIVADIPSGLCLTPAKDKNCTWFLFWIEFFCQLGSIRG
jgi:hypothetical protein